MKRRQQTIVPKNIWDKMSPEAQKLYSAGHVTTQDIEKWHKGREKEMHDQFASWLDRNGYWKQYIHARMDKKTGIGKGVFDFTVWNEGRVAFVEFKTDKGRLSEDQKDFLACQIANGTPALIAHCYMDAAAFIQDVFCTIHR
jgi:VRR-NUC domain